MAITGTRISDLVASEKRLANTVDLLARTTNELVTSGLAVSGPETQVLMQGGPRRGSLPFIAPLATNEVNISTDDITQDGSVGKLTAAEFGVVRLDMNYAWGYADLTRMITQFDVRGGISAGIADYWNAITKQYAISAMKGALAADAGLTTTAATTDLGIGLITGAAATADVYADRFDVMIISPKTKAKLQTAEPNAFIPASKTDLKLADYAGYKVIVSNAFGDNTTVLARSGALAFDVGTVPYEIAIEIERLANKGNGGGAEVLHSRRSLVAHPQGFNYSPAANVANATTPDKALLETASTWSLAVPLVQVPFRKIVHKSS